ncbi:MAG: hypothetical protein K2M00_04495 [Muribaculaceae bacterium]|nr:hypothetical protein [Muribaculaceae bacterium]
MKRSVLRTVAAGLLLVFVNFMFANVVFMHTHSLDNGASITHSHPYLPSSQHSHSGAALDNIAAMNAAALTVRASLPASCQFISDNAFISIDFTFCREAACSHSLLSCLRAPPAV